MLPRERTNWNACSSPLPRGRDGERPWQGIAKLRGSFPVELALSSLPQTLTISPTLGKSLAKCCRPGRIQQHPRQKSKACSPHKVNVTGNPGRHNAGEGSIYFSTQYPRGDTYLGGGFYTHPKSPFHSQSSPSATCLLLQVTASQEWCGNVLSHSSIPFVTTGGAWQTSPHPSKAMAFVPLKPAHPPLVPFYPELLPCPWGV